MWAKMRKIAAALILAVSLVVAGPGFSSPGLAVEVVTVENNTGFPICELYLAPAATDDWSANLLAGPCLAQGETRALDRSPDGARCDLLIVSDHGLDRRYYGLDLANAHLRLNVAEVELFEWNPALGR